MSSNPLPAITLPLQSQPIVDLASGDITVPWYRALQQWLGATVSSSNNNGILGPYAAASTGISWDAAGSAGPGWGNAASVYSSIPFKCPDGYRVQIIRVYGNLFVMPAIPTPPVTLPIGSASGFLWSLQNTWNTDTPSVWEAGPIPSPNLLADGAMTYYQGAITSQQTEVNIGFNVDIVNGILGPDNILDSKFAIFLNTTAGQIHMEVSFVTVFQLVPLSLVTDTATGSFYGTPPVL